MPNQHPTVNQQIFIDRSNRIHNFKYGYEKVCYINATTKVSITCFEHGEFLVSPKNHHHHKSGCPKCGALSRKEKHPKYMNTEIFVQRAKSCHGEKYSYDKTIYVNAKTPVTITCDLHGDFKSGYHHILGIGCQKCGVEKSRTTKQKMGYSISDNQRNDYELYESRVNRITEYNYRIHKDKINPLNYPRGRKLWHVDHIFSKQQGFIEHVEPEIIGHWTNLQMLDHAVNRSKSMSCLVSKEILVATYLEAISNS